MVDIASRKYEYKPDGSMSAAAESLIADIQACARLGIPFSVTTMRQKKFRHGGNVNKAEIEFFYLEIGQVTKLEDS